MAFVLNDRVFETTEVVGTGPATLLGASTGFQPFNVGIGASNTTYYCIVNPNVAAEWEVGLGTLDATGTILTRTTVYRSSNSNSAVTFTAGTKPVFCTYAASRAIIQDASGNSSTAGTFTAGGAITATTGNITASSGAISATGNISTSGGTITSAGAITATTGNITATAGGITANAASTFNGTATITSATNSPLTVNNNTTGTALANSVASFFGNVNSYSQVNYQNVNSGGSASTDFIATANNGSDTTFYVDLGINSSGYNDPAYTMFGANDAYLYSQSSNIAIGTATAAKSVKFFQGGTLAANEVARFAPTTNNLLVGTTSDGAGTSKLRVNGIIESMSGGFKFPSGAIMTNPGAAAVYTQKINLGTTPIQSYTYSFSDAGATTSTIISMVPTSGGSNDGVIMALGPITGGSGYTDGTYTDVTLTNVTGTGTGAYGTVVVSGGAVTSVVLANPDNEGTGSGYATGNILSATALSLGGTGSGFSVTVGLISMGGDELEMDGISVSAYCATNGTITVNINASPGYIAGGRTFAYTLG